MDSSQSWDAQRKSQKSKWTCPHWGNRPGRRRPEVSARGEDAALRREIRPPVRAEPDAKAWQSVDCRARRVRRVRSGRVGPGWRDQRWSRLVRQTTAYLQELAAL